MRLSVASVTLLLCAFILPVASARLPHSHTHTERAKSHAHQTIRMALTIDDLPGGGPEVGELTHARILTEIIAQLRAHNVQHATGFVVGSMLEGQPESQAALANWVDAGFEVGNHTYSHRSLDEIGLDAYLQDIEKNRSIVDALDRRPGRHVRYFRYPYLEEGRTETERRTLAHFLAAQHYVPARVSVDFSDWAWAEPYARCMEHEDDQALELLTRSYLENASAFLAWSVAAAHQVLGHSIDHVLLLHANVATARILDALLTAYEKAGVRYVSLTEALSESVYTADYDVSGGNVLGQASHQLKRPHPPWLVRPLALLDLACH
jgi:peptidoglycan/xylan/chitin deacetylase (PgdA/CDA1 family)